MFSSSVLLSSAATIPSLASRPFLAAFVVAMFARFGIPGTEMTIAGPPEWFVADMTLFVLGLLGIGEVVAHKIPEVRTVLNELDSVVKAVVSLIVSSALVDEESALIMAAIAGDPGMSTAFAGAWSLTTSTGTWFVSKTRNSFFVFFSEMDEDDDIGFQGAFSWLEDIFAVFGVWIAILIPVIALALYGVTLLALWLIQKRIERNIELSRVPCHACSTLIYPTAAVCTTCYAPNKKAQKVGLFGQPTGELAPANYDLAFNLLSHRKCPDCAIRLPHKSPHQDCPTCNRTIFKDPHELSDYIRKLDNKMILTTAVCGFLGLIPFAGIIMGTVYYRLSLIGSLRTYIPKTSGCMTRFGVRIWNLILISLQPIPIVGGFTMALMCFTNYQIYKRVLLNQGNKKIQPTIVPDQLTERLA
ncbi:MAG: DUF4126 domain-containing protein [Chloroflexota bacterium]